MNLEGLINRNSRKEGSFQFTSGLPEKTAGVREMIVSSTVENQRRWTKIHSTSPSRLREGRLGVFGKRPAAEISFATTFDLFRRPAQRSLYSARGVRGVEI